MRGVAIVAATHGQVLGDESDGRSKELGVLAQRKMFLGKEIVVDARTEYRLKWAHRGIGTFSFFGVLCYIVSYSISNNVFRNHCYCVFCLGYLCIVMLLYKTYRL